MSTTSAIYRQNRNQVDLYRSSHSPGASFEHIIKKITKKIKRAGFGVLSWEISVDGQLQQSSVDEADSENEPSSNQFNPVRGLYSKYKQKSFKKSHIQNCQKCRDELESEKEKRSDSSLNGSFTTVVETQQKEYRVVFFVGGMTCVSCASAVGEALGKAFQELHIESKHDEPSYSVNLLQHSAVAIVPNKQVINSLVNTILDSGFDCKILEVLPVERSINVKVTAAIGGITCSACAISIESAVHELPFVLDSNINTITKTGMFVMDDSDSNLESLKTTVEDCGFDFEVLNVTKINYVSGKKQSRTVNLEVEGMFCVHCPELVYDYLSSYGEVISVEDELTLSHPLLKFTYIPNQEKGLNIRKIIKDLNHLRSTDGDEAYTIDYSKQGPFTCNFIEPVSMDEHLRELAKKDVKTIALRLFLAAVVAIPTFVFGVVAMSLLPKHHAFRVWIEKPLWTGNVSRSTWILFFLSTPVYFFAADLFHRKAIVEVRSLWMHKNSFKRRLFKFGSMNLLMCLGTTIAYVSSIVLLILSSQQSSESMDALHTTYFDSVVFLTFFLLIGRLLEGASKSKTAEAISGLNKFKVSSATLVDRVPSGNNEYKYENDQTIDIKFLEVEDYIRIATGESPPVDCVIVENSAEFDESALTGESKPVKHSPGNQVFSGTVNVSNQAVIAKILSLQSDSLIDQILNTVREGQMRKAPIERTADALTGYFVPIIVFIGILVFIIWLILSYSGALPDSYLDVDIGGWFMWSLQFAIAVFVIACPCGIGLAAPTALFVGSGLAAKNGILVKGGGAAFQDAANTKVVCFDKTGTLTYGEIKVTDHQFCTDDEQMQSVAVQLARDLELSSKHPLAQAIKSFTSQFALTSNKIPAVETVPGKGLKGSIVAGDTDGFWNGLTGNVAILGNEALIDDYNVDISDEQKSILEEWKSEKKSVILVALLSEHKNQLLVMFACRDQIRHESKDIIDHLQNQLGIECWMITGDNCVTAQAIGSELGLDSEHIVSGVLPDEKQMHIKRIKGLRNTVIAMVGDGINDAPALAAADIGVALASGADIAVTSSDFILLNKSHPLTTLVTLFDLSTKVLNRVKFNFAWALVYNMIGIPIAAGVIYPYHNSRLSPVWASAAMAASSVSVVLSSLALNWYRPIVPKEQPKQAPEHI
ncbi:hypothetical protein PSN45_002571 [Yamadazyma tenuis]|nr:hypothetical protein PSN45_002571 [Yamadazyma tenuis]